MFDIFFDLKNKLVTLNNGCKMPVIGLGTYGLTGKNCFNAVLSALQSGYRLIDSASFYGNERDIGAAVKASGIPRDEIFITTKLYPNQYACAEQAIDEALGKLDSGYIDLMLLHHPGRYETEAYRMMEQAVQKGKIRSIGVSCYYIRELDAFLPGIETVPAVVQNEIHPYYQDTDVVAYIRQKGIVVEGWYPLGGRGYTKELLGNKTLQEIGAKYGKTAAQVILRWNLQRNIVVIPGSGNPAHIKENTNIFDFELTDEDMEKISRLDRKEKHDWY